MPAPYSHGGDVDLSVIGSLVCDPARSRILLALNDGRALPATVLASEAGVAPSTASSHLAKLVGGGLLRVEPHGRHRYYRLSGPIVGDLLELLCRLSPPRPVRSLREGNQAAALRAARSCYDHLAGRLGVTVMAKMIGRGLITGGTGVYDPAYAIKDQPSAYGKDCEYELTEAGSAFIQNMALDLPTPKAQIRYCVDWSEQQHHLAGKLGKAMLSHFLTENWVIRTPRSRALRVTDLGRQELDDVFGIQWQ